jgi:hypothetical protein
VIAWSISGKPTPVIARRSCARLPIPGSPRSG